MGITAGDYAIAGLGGAVEGFFEGQSKANAEAKAQAQVERQAKLLMLKEERQHTWEAAKQKDQQTFELGKLEKEHGFKTSEAEKKRAQDLFDTGEKNEFELKKIGIQNDNAKTLEGIRSQRYIDVAEMKAGNSKTGKLTEAQQFRLEDKLAKLEDGGVSEMNINQVNTLREQLGQPVYEKVKVKDGEPGGFFGGKKEPEYEYRLREETGAAGMKAPAGSKFSSIFEKVTGAASRTKQGANDSVQEPAPIMVSPGGAVSTDALPMFNNNRRQ